MHLQTAAWSGHMILQRRGWRSPSAGCNRGIKWQLITWGDRTMPTSSPPSKRGSVLRKNSLEATWSASKMHSNSWPGTGVPCMPPQHLVRMWSLRFCRAWTVSSINPLLWLCSVEGFGFVDRAHLGDRPSRPPDQLPAIACDTEPLVHFLFPAAETILAAKNMKELLALSAWSADYELLEQSLLCDDKQLLFRSSGLCCERTSGYICATTLFKFPDLPFISPEARLRPDTYCTSGPMVSHHLRFFGSLPSSQR